MNESYLARLTDSCFIICKSSATEELCWLHDIIIEAYIMQETSASSTSSSLTRIAMYGHNIFRIL